MAYDKTPWFVGAAGVEHSAEVARGLAYAATGGKSGIMGATDLKIVELPTPGGSVQYMPGTVGMVSLYPGGAGQSYIGRAGTAGTITIAPTTSAGGRSDLVIGRVRDPQYGTYNGFNPGTPNIGFDFFTVEVIQGVAAGTTKLEVSYPHVVLARIDIPASTGTITNAMIKDLRTKLNAQSSIWIKTAYPTQNHNMPKGTYNYWPLISGQNITVPIPEWATKMFVKVYLTGIEVTNVGNGAGIRGVLGNQLIDNEHTTIHTNTVGRISHVHISEFTIPASYRGKGIIFGLQGNHTLGTGNIQADYQTSIAYEFHFREDAI